MPGSPHCVSLVSSETEHQAQAQRQNRPSTRAATPPRFSAVIAKRWQLSNAFLTIRSHTQLQGSHLGAFPKAHTLTQRVWGRSQASVVLKSPHMFLKSGLIEKPLHYSLDGGGGVKRKKKTQAARKTNSDTGEGQGRGGDCRV